MTIYIFYIKTNRSVKICRQLSISMGSAFTDSTKHRSKIYGKKFQKVSKAELEFATHWQPFT